METEILDFISRRFQEDCHWLDGNCLWFAHILKMRFPQLEIYYLPIEGHFVCGDPRTGLFFDWRGKILVWEEPQMLSDIKEQDSLYYDHLIRDCFN